MRLNYETVVGYDKTSTERRNGRKLWIRFVRIFRNSFEVDRRLPTEWNTRRIFRTAFATFIETERRRVVVYVVCKTSAMEVGRFCFDKADTMLTLENKLNGQNVFKQLSECSTKFSVHVSERVNRSRGERRFKTDINADVGEGRFLKRRFSLAVALSDK